MIGDTHSGLTELIGRSRLLGSNRSVTNYGGGNTSAKLLMPDPLTGDNVEVLFVKGSGGDLGTITSEGFATLYLNQLHSLRRKYRGPEHEDEMVDMLPYCIFGANLRAPSIDTFLHAYLPPKHIDHTHPDDVISIAASIDGERLTAEIFQGDIGWLPWQRPGFDLGLKIEQLYQENPQLKGVILGQHGLFTWGETSESCYNNTIEVIRLAGEYIREHSKEPFGGQKCQSLEVPERNKIVAELMPILRGIVSSEGVVGRAYNEPTVFKIGHYSDASKVMEFVNSDMLKTLAEKGTSCPDHFLLAKKTPLVIDFHPNKENVEDIIARAEVQIQGYRDRYTAYYESNRTEYSPGMRDPNPVVILIPGIGMFTFAGNKTIAMRTAEFYTHAISAMRGASAISSYQGLPDEEAFRIEYWKLEERKLRSLPQPKPLEGRVALITGGAGGIGKATAIKFLQEGAHVVLTDFNEERLNAVREELADMYDKDRIRGYVGDVTNQQQIEAYHLATVAEYGGLDILVNNAGFAYAASFTETTEELWERSMGVMAKGYWLNAHEAFKIMEAQNMGGRVIFVGSKNAIVPSDGAFAYNVAKATSLAVGRNLVKQLAESGITLNVVNPDAVMDTNIWDSNWREQRAKQYGIPEERLEEHYRRRTLLGVNICSEDVADAIYYLVMLPKTTGTMINVDGGNIQTITF